MGLLGVLWLDTIGWYTMIGPQVAQPVGVGSVHLAHHAINLPATPPICLQMWTQGFILPVFGSPSPPWWLTDFFAEPAWIF
ncbi:MAG TPA: hypothetical protein EYP98_18390 [Planctomycetes bacterium]|nr:hypothetical protein [Planctomycetota bacterium]